MADDDRATFAACTGRTEPVAGGHREAWLCVGRRGGKSIILALVAVFLACFVDWLPFLSPGERGIIMVVAADRKQARVIYRYARAMLTRIPMLAPLVERETAEAIDLTNNISIEIVTASFRTIRGPTVIAALLDEIAFWRAEDSANPDAEILAALRPAMATIPNAMLLAASSPYARRGVLWDTFRRHHGQSDSPVLVWQAPTRTMNPTVPQSVIDDAIERDPASAAAEYGAEFRIDIETFITREVVEAAVIAGRHELPPVSGANYVAFVDPSGGSADSMTLAIAHAVEGRAALDAIRERKPPFSPDDVVKEFAALLRAYRVSRVVGDRYAGEWPRERFRVHGIDYVLADKPKSDLYRDLLPLLNSGRVELLDHPRLIGQLCGLERRTARGGRDSIDHPPGAHDDLGNAVAGAIVHLIAENAADGWIDWARRGAEEAHRTPGPADDDAPRPEPFRLPGNSNPNEPAAPEHSGQTDSNPVMTAYLDALRAFHDGPLTLQSPALLCAFCKKPTRTRVTDGVRCWCNQGCQSSWARALAERQRSRERIAMGLPPVKLGIAAFAPLTAIRVPCPFPRRFHLIPVQPSWNETL